MRTEQRRQPNPAQSYDCDTLTHVQFGSIQNRTTSGQNSTTKDCLNGRAEVVLYRYQATTMTDRVICETRNPKVVVNHLPVDGDAFNS
jgi:hypothetical protein